MGEGRRGVKNEGNDKGMVGRGNEEKEKEGKGKQKKRKG